MTYLYIWHKCTTPFMTYLKRAAVHICLWLSYFNTTQAKQDQNHFFKALHLDVLIVFRIWSRHLYLSGAVGHIVSTINFVLSVLFRDKGGCAVRWSQLKTAQCKISLYLRECELRVCYSLGCVYIPHFRADGTYFCHVKLTLMKY